MSVFEKWLNSKLKGVVREVFSCLTVMLITSLVGMMIVGPVVGIVSRGALDGIEWLQIHLPVAAWVLFDATVPLQILTGTHWVFVSLAITNMGEYGVECGFMVGYFLLTMSLTAVGLVARKRMVSREKRNLVTSSLLAVIFTGTTEPVLYSVCITNKIAMLAAIAAGGVAGIYQGLVTIRCYTYAFPTIFSILIFHSRENIHNVWNAAIAGLIAFVTALIIMKIGYKDTSEV